MYRELEKYKTNKKIKSVGVFPDGRKKEIELHEYKINLGDLINDFIAHKKKKFWQRKYYHNHLTKIYIKILNQIELTYGI